MGVERASVCLQKSGTDVCVRGLLRKAVLFSTLLVVIGGCQRVLPDSATPRSPDSPDLAGHPSTTPSGERFDDGHAGELPAPPAEDAEELDSILDSPWASHPELEERIEFWVEFWSGRGSEHFHRYLERMHRYQDLVDGELARRGVPASLRYLPIVESGYNPVAVSRVGATGLWQLMPATATYLGVSVGRLVDGRRDPVASTHAALDYLEELHGQFGSWFLALAAYNAGPGRVGRALNAHISADVYDDGTFLEVRRHLPAETREFVPRFFAAAHIARDPAAHGFTEIRPQPVYAYESVSVPDATSLDVVARSAGVGQNTVEALNPHLLRGFTPAGTETQVRVPRGTAERFAVSYAQLPPDERISFVEHEVGPGETLTHIARAYGVPLADLRAANGQVNPRAMQIGQRLVIPRGGASGQATAGAQVAEASQEDGGAGATYREVEHRVRPGESLWSIARTYGVQVSQLRSWNGLGQDPVLHPGQELTVRSSGQVRLHRVASGDTLSGIASRYGVSTQELARANGLGLSDVIRPGEELTVPSGTR